MKANISWTGSLPVTGIDTKASSYETLKQTLKQEIINFSQQYPLSNEKNIDAHITLVLKKNYRRLKEALPIKGSAPYHFWRLKHFLKWVSSRTIKEVLDFYEDQYMAILYAPRSKEEQAREEFIMEGLRQD